MMFDDAGSAAEVTEHSLQRQTLHPPSTPFNYSQAARDAAASLLEKNNPELQVQPVRAHATSRAAHALQQT